MLVTPGVPLRLQVRAVERPVVKVAKINLPPKPKTKKSKRAKVAAMELKTKLRRRAHHYRVLAAIAELIPRDADVDGHAKGTLRDEDIVGHARGVSGKDVIRALMHWQRWRVLWLWWKGARTRDIRFDRGLVEKILATWAEEPRKVLDLLREHRAQREAVAPWPRVPREGIQVVNATGDQLTA